MTADPIDRAGDLPVYPLAKGARFRGIDWVPLFFRDMGDSRWLRETSGEAVRLGMILLCASMDQDPPGTLPLDDGSLADLARLGRDVDEWRRWRPDALWRWTEYGIEGAQEGDLVEVRLGHPYVARIVVDVIDRQGAKRDKADASAYRARLSRVRQAMKRLGYHGSMISNRTLVAKIEEVLSERNWTRADDNVDRALDIVQGDRTVTELRPNGRS